MAFADWSLAEQGSYRRDHDALVRACERAGCTERGCKVEVHYQVGPMRFVVKHNGDVKCVHEDDKLYRYNSDWLAVTLMEFHPPTREEATQPEDMFSHGQWVGEGR
jgi:hypothetical protein